MADAASERGRVTSFASLKLVQMCEVILSQENFFAKVKTLHKGKDGTELSLKYLAIFLELIKSFFACFLLSKTSLVCNFLILIFIFFAIFGLNLSFFANNLLKALSSFEVTVSFAKITSQ